MKKIFEIIENVISFFELIYIIIIWAFGYFRESYRFWYNVVIILGLFFGVCLALFLFGLFLSLTNPGEGLAWYIFLGMINHPWISVPAVLLSGGWGYLSLKELEAGNCHLPISEFFD